MSVNITQKAVFELWGSEVDERLEVQQAVANIKNGTIDPSTLPTHTTDHSIHILYTNNCTIWLTLDPPLEIWWK